MLEKLTIRQRIFAEDLLAGPNPNPAVGVEKQRPGGADAFRQYVHRESRIPLRSLRQPKRRWEWAELHPGFGLSPQLVTCGGQAIWYLYHVETICSRYRVSKKPD